MVGLILLASLPGPLQLAHQHAGGERAHVHLDAEALAARDLLEQHAHPHPHPHPHRHAHSAARPERAESSESSQDGPCLRAVHDYHVHAFNPLRLAARTTAAIDAIPLLTVSAAETPPRTPASRPRRAARPRGPPALLVG
jgi:hypothetical protein